MSWFRLDTLYIRGIITLSSVLLQILIKHTSENEEKTPIVYILWLVIEMECILYFIDYLYFIDAIKWISFGEIDKNSPIEKLLDFCTSVCVYARDVASTHQYIYYGASNKSYYKSNRREKMANLNSIADINQTFATCDLVPIFRSTSNLFNSFGFFSSFQWNGSIFLSAGVRKTKQKIELFIFHMRYILPIVMDVLNDRLEYHFICVYVCILNKVKTR